jgi:hypothetical protein
MLYEVDAFHIKATLVEPGHMRIDEATGLDDVGVSTEHTGELRKYGHFLIKAPSAPYDSPTAPAGHARRLVQWMTDCQPVSAVKSAELTWQLGHCRYPPLRLLLGSVAVESVRDRLRSVIEEIEDWKHLQFPEPSGLGQSHDDDDAGDAEDDGDEVIEDAADSDHDNEVVGGDADIMIDADDRLES